ncbi:MAG: thioredoxin [Nitrososphaerales archaeon]|nr:thioredoxin [Nitrososphaerales archaeon]
MDELEWIKQKKLREMMDRIKAEKKAEQDDWPDKPIELTDKNFKETIRKYPLIVVDFWAEWCGPCRMIAPIIDELAREYKGRIVFGKLNVDLNRTTAMNYGIMSIPTLLIFKNGQLVDQIVGAMPKRVLEATITQYL